MNEIDLKLQAIIGSINSQGDVNKLLICKINAMETALKQLDPRLYEVYALTLYQLYQETDFAHPINSDHSDQ